MLVVLALIRAFAPHFEFGRSDIGVAAYDVPLRTEAKARQVPVRQAEAASGAAAPAGRKAEPRETIAPVSNIVLSSQAAPVVASTGAADSAGASVAGAGPAAGGTGIGSGAGGIGTGQGGGAIKAVKLSGDIVSARDYPGKTRDLRMGSAVTIALTVGIDGQVDACRIVHPSPDPEADRITCALATERFRFRPARDATGRPVTSIYGWQQRWFSPAGR